MKIAPQIISGKTSKKLTSKFHRITIRHEHALSLYGIPELDLDGKLLIWLFFFPRTKQDFLSNFP